MLIRKDIHLQMYKLSIKKLYTISRKVQQYKSKIKTSQPWISILYNKTSKRFFCRLRSVARDGRRPRWNKSGRAL